MDTLPDGDARGRGGAGAGGSAGAAWLDPIAGPTLDAVELRRDQALDVGRDEACALRLGHESVSRRHCRIEHRDGRWWVRDLGSTHGTAVDGERIAPGVEMAIAPGATITVGPWIFRLRGAGSDAPVRAPRVERIDPAGGATRPTIFIRLRADDTRQRELSWQEFCTRYAPVIVGFARHAGLAGQEADDVLQEVLLAFFRVSPRFEYDPGKGRFRGYLKRATLNVIRRRHRRAAPAALTHDPQDEDGDDPHLARHWEEAWEAQLMERALQEVRDHVDQRTWEAFELYARREMPAEEVARRLDLNVNSVHQARSRVLRAARKAVERMRDEEG